MKQGRVGHLRVPVRLLDLALRGFPRGFRVRYGAEMREAFAAEVERRRRCGSGAVASYTLRALVDLVKQGWRERVRRGPLPGHGQRAPEPRRGGGMLQGIWTDVRLAVRGVRRAPGFASAAVVVLALGIGANTTVFSALKTAILAPPPYPDTDRLVMVDVTNHRRGEGQVESFPWSYAKFQAYLDRPGRLVDPVAGYAQRTATLTDAGDPARIPIELVSPGYFGILGVTAVVGRVFTAEDGNADAPNLVAVISHALWRSRFAGDADAVGRFLTLNGQRLQVVGVAPEGFGGLTGGAEAWMPLAASAAVFNPFMVTGAQAHWFHAVGRLRPQATLAEARAQTRSLGQGIAEEFPIDDPNEIYGADLRAFDDVRVNADARSAVVLLTVAAALVLLVACANLSGLLLARARRQSRDGAVRLAVGASRWRLIRASLVESGVLAGLGGSVGVLISVAGTRALASAWPERFLSSGAGEMAFMDRGAMGVDPAVLGFAVLATAVTAALFGLAPAVRASRADLAVQLKEGGRATRGGRGSLGVDARSVLVGAQVGLALVLLVGAALVGGSMKRLLDVDRGFDAERLLTFQYAIPRTDAWAERPAEFHAAFLERLASLPGVESVTIGDAPLAGHSWTTRVQDIPGHEPIPQGEGATIGVHMVGDDHFAMLGIPLLRGRALDERDGTDGNATMVISKLAAETLFPGEDPVGKRIRIGVSDDDHDPYTEIVGVVGDVLYNRPDQDPIPEGYFSYREWGDASATILIRTAGDPLSLMPAVRDQLKALDPTLAVFRITTMDDLAGDAMGDRTVVLALLALFAALTVLLAATGTWGVVSYAVADRRKELGLRMALGADGARVLGMILRQSLVTAVVGLAVGLAGAWAGTRLLNAFLFETDARDPLAFGGAAALLFSVVLVASYVPARRATKVDPVEALRAE